MVKGQSSPANTEPGGLSTNEGPCTLYTTGLNSRVLSARLGHARCPLTAPTLAMVMPFDDDHARCPLLPRACVTCRCLFPSERAPFESQARPAYQV